MRISTRELWEVNKYLWLCLLFVAVYIPWAAARGALTVTIPVAYAVFALAIVNGAARSWCAWRAGGFNGRAASAVFNLTDITLISVAVRITGGLASDLWLLYFVLVVSETLYSTPREVATLHVALVAAYVAATWTSHGQPGYPLAVATRMFFMVVVGSFGLRLTTDRARRDREVAQLNEQIAASDERARIAREVHDSLGHALVASILRLELCKRLIGKDAGEAENLLGSEIAALRAAWTEGRNLAFHLRPWEADDADLPECLRRHVGRFAERTGLAVDLAVEGGPWDLPAAVRLAATRIVQEALTNIAKHAQAGRVAVRLARSGSGALVECRVEDDGVGFDADAHSGSFGLTAMRDRAEKLGGRFALTTRPGGGTCVHISLPAR